MSAVLIDSSVWIDYFRDSKKHREVDELIKNNLACTNDLILAELLPVIILENENRVSAALKSLPKKPLHIDWESIVTFQTDNLRNGINRVGVPDLIILQHVIQYDLFLFTGDNHFYRMHEIFNFRLFME